MGVSLLDGFLALGFHVYKYRFPFLSGQCTKLFLSFLVILTLVFFCILFLQCSHGLGPGFGHGADGEADGDVGSSSETSSSLSSPAPVLVLVLALALAPAPADALAPALVSFTY